MPGEGLTHGPRAVKKHGEGTTGSAESSGIPCAMVLTLMARSPWEPGLIAPIAREIITSRTWPQRREARTTRFRVRINAVRPHESSCASPKRPPHPAPNVRDDREAPLSIERGTVHIMLLIPGKVKAIHENQNMPTATDWHDGQ